MTDKLTGIVYVSIVINIVITRIEIFTSSVSVPIFNHKFCP